MSTKNEWSDFSDGIEENLIAFFLGLMVLITFVNVVARYAFNSNILWALEATVFLFAWLVLIGVSYGVKKAIHLGVDVVVSATSPKIKKALTIVAVLVCILYAGLLLVGSWDYWYPFASKRAFYETEDLIMPDMLQFLSVWLNDGEPYEKLPRFIPYAALPIGMALLLLRYIQLMFRVFSGKAELIIASHEVENDVEALVENSKNNDGGKA